MATIDDVRLPEYIEQGSTGGPTFSTSVFTLSSGHEARNQNWQSARCVYDISYGIQSQDDYDEVLKFFYARRGRLRGFRFKDWSDFACMAEPLTGDGSGNFQLTRTYVDTVSSYVRKITRPVANTIVVYANGTPTTFTLGANGLLTGIGAGTITADFEFDVPVRFDSDVLSLEMYQANASAVQAINLVEVLE